MDDDAFSGQYVKVNVLAYQMSREGTQKIINIF